MLGNGVSGFRYLHLIVFMSIFLNIKGGKRNIITVFSKPCLAEQSLTKAAKIMTIAFESDIARPQMAASIAAVILFLKYPNFVDVFVAHAPGAARGAMTSSHNLTTFLDVKASEICSSVLLGLLKST